MNATDGTRFRYGSAGAAACEGMDCSPEALHNVLDATLVVHRLSALGVDVMCRELIEARTALAQARADAGMRRLGARSRQEHGAS